MCRGPGWLGWAGLASTRLLVPCFCPASLACLELWTWNERARLVRRMCVERWEPQGRLTVGSLFFETVTEDVVRSGLGLVFLRELLTATAARTNSGARRVGSLRAGKPGWHCVFSHAFSCEVWVCWRKATRMTWWDGNWGGSSLCDVMKGGRGSGKRLWRAGGCG